METPDAGQLPAAYPAPDVVVIAGRRIEIQKAGVRQCTLVHQRAMVLIAMMDDSVDELTYIDEHPADVNPLLAFALDLDEEWIATLGPDEKLDLALAWVKVNTRFFVKRLLPARTRLQAAIQELSGVGSPPSTSSVPTDIPMPTTIPPTQLRSGSTSPSAPNGAGAPTP